MALSPLHFFHSSNANGPSGFSKKSVDTLSHYLNQAEANQKIFVPRASFLVNMRGGVESLKLNAAHIFKSKPKFEAGETSSSESSNELPLHHTAKPSIDETRIRVLRRAEKQLLSVEDEAKFNWVFKHYPQVRQFLENSLNVNSQSYTESQSAQHQLQLRNHIDNLIELIEPDDIHIDPESHDGSIRLKSLSDDIHAFLKAAQVADTKLLFKEWKPFLEDHDLQKDIANALAKGTLDNLDKTDSYSTAVFSVIHQNEQGDVQIETHNEFADKLLKILLKNKGDLRLTENSAPVILNVRNTEEFKETYERVIKHFRVGNKVPVQHKGKEPTSSHIKESHAYSFIESLITKGTQEAELLDRVDGKDGLSTKACLDEFLKSSVCHFESPDKKLEAFLNHELTHNQKDLKAALTATQALSLHYAEQLQKREVAGSLLLGAAVGGGGEVIIEKVLHDLSPGAQTALRMLLFAFVDFVDNSLGELGTLMADLTGMGLKLSKKDIFNIEGAMTGMQKAVKYPGMFLDLLIKGDAPGPAGLPVGIALRAASSAALFGIALNYWPATVYSNKDAGIAELMGATVLSVGGTSLSIPLNLLFTFPRSMAAVADHIHQGRIQIPQEVQELINRARQDMQALHEAQDKDPSGRNENISHLAAKAAESYKKAETAMNNFIYTQALKDLVARIGFSASIKAFSSIGALALVWPLMQAGAPREVLQPVVMAVSPAMENLCRFFYTAATSYGFPGRVRGISNAVLTTAQDGAKVSTNALMNMATGKPTRFLTRIWEGMTYPAQRVLTVRNAIINPVNSYPDIPIEENPQPVRASEYMTGIETLANKVLGRQRQATSTAVEV